MGKNSDTNNIFSYYMDNILLKEAVKPTEEEGTATSQAEKDPKWMQAKSAWENLTGKKLDQMPANQRISISQNVLKPAAQKGYLENPRTKERTPISGGGTTAQPTQQAVPATQAAPATTPVQQQPASQPAPVEAQAQAKRTIPPPAEEAPKPSAVATVPPPQDQNVQVKRAENPYTTEYQGASIVDFLKQSGQGSDMASRKAIAQRMGIQDYKGTAEQNTQMLNALKKQAQDFAKTPQVATPAQVAQAQQAAPQLNVPEIKNQSVQAVQQMKAPEEPFKMQTPQQSGNIAQGPTNSAAAQQNQQQVAQQSPTTTPQQQTNTDTPFIRDLKKITQNLYGGANKPQQQVASNQQPAKSEASEEEANEENCEDCENNCEKCKKNKSKSLNKITVQEKVNISKFLKHLSEKNYSSAHKYLKAIVDDKVKAKIAQRIAKI